MMTSYFFYSDVKKFVFSLEEQTVYDIFRTIENLEEKGHRLGMPWSKSLGAGLFELRISGLQTVRLFYVFHQNSVYFLYGFLKKSQEIPHRHLSIVRRRQSFFDHSHRS